MSADDSFDPYRIWLGIPAEEQPPHHYRLLGLKQLETNPEVIAHAADARMVHLKTFQTGRYSLLSQQLLNEVASAKLCLLDPQKKAAYDAQLQRSIHTPSRWRAQSPTQTPSQSPPPQPPPPQPPPPQPPPLQPQPLQPPPVQPPAYQSAEFRPPESRAAEFHSSQFPPPPSPSLRTQAAPVPPPPGRTYPTGKPETPESRDLAELGVSRIHPYVDRRKRSSWLKVAIFFAVLAGMLGLVILLAVLSG